MNVSDAGLKLIAEFEGFSDRLYDDPVGHATIGYGFLVHLGNYHRNKGTCALCDHWQNGAPGAITPAQGRAMLREKVKAYADAVTRYTVVTLTQPQFDALTSFTYNVGQGGYRDSSVRRAVNAGGNVCAELRRYVRGTNGVIYPGLVRRREAECAMFNSVGGDDVFHRLNGRSAWFDDPTHQRYEIGPHHMNLAADFPNLPAEAHAVELDVRIDPSTLGRIVVKDGDGSYAGDASRYVPERIIRVIPGDLPDRRVLFDVRDAPVRFRLVGIVGWW